MFNILLFNISSEKPVNIELWDMNVNASSTNGEKNDSENKNANKNKSRKRGKRRSTNSSRLVTDPTVTNDLVPSDLKSPAPLLSANQIVPKNAVESELVLKTLTLCRPILSAYYLVDFES